MYRYMYNMTMKKRYSISEARANLPAIVGWVEVGRSVELTRHGRPVAAVVSVQELARLRSGRRDFRTAYRGFLERFDLAEVGVEAGYFEEARDSGEGRDVDL